MFLAKQTILVLNTNYPCTTPWFIWINIYSGWNYCIHNCFLCCWEIPKIVSNWNVLHIFSLMNINVIDKIALTGCISKYEKYQSYTHLACCCYIVWLDYNLICLLYHPCQRTLFSWNEFMHWCFDKMFNCISQLMTFVPFLVSSTFWMKGSIYFNKSRIRHIPLCQRSIVFDLELTCRRNLCMSWWISKWFKTVYIWRYQRNFQQNAKESIHFGHRNVSPLISDKWCVYVI